MDCPQCGKFELDYNGYCPECGRLGVVSQGRKERVEVPGPGIEVFLGIIAALVLLISSVSLIGELFDASGQGGEYGIAGIVLSCLLFGVISLLRRLASIEAHIRFYVERNLLADKTFIANEPSDRPLHPDEKGVNESKPYQ